MKVGVNLDNYAQAETMKDGDVIVGLAIGSRAASLWIQAIHVRDVPREQLIETTAIRIARKFIEFPQSWIVTIEHALRRHLERWPEQTSTREYVSEYEGVAPLGLGDG